MIQTVTGPLPADRLGRTLTHEHLFNDVRAAVVPGARPGTEDLLDTPIARVDRTRLITEPYSSRDNCTLDDPADALAELAAFRAAGGSSVIDLTPPALGRNPAGLHRASVDSGINVIMGSGWYLENFETAAGTAEYGRVDRLAAALSAEFRDGVDGIRPGVIGEIGISPAFTPGEAAALRAACLVQLDHGVPLFIHLPGWQRRGPEVLGIVLDEMGVDPGAVVLCHMDPSGSDGGYQRALADAGVWLEFDMIGMPFSYPGEGVSPGVIETADALAALVSAGHSDRLLLSHDLFLKAMLGRYDGRGLGFVPGEFRDLLLHRGINADRLLDHNPASLFIHAHKGITSS